MSNASLASMNAARWSKAKVTRASELTAVANKLVANKSRYQAVAKATGVPWHVIAVIHQRESSGSVAGVLHNGEKILGTAAKTKLVPAGRGPFSTWEQAAIDALVNCHPYAARNMDWSIGGTLALLERYNGLGYFNKGLPSPYIWAGTDQYVKGKYVADGKFDPNHVDRQLGCAGLLKAMQVLDPSIKFGSLGGSAAVAVATVLGGAGTAAVVVQDGPPTWVLVLLAFGVIGAAYLFIQSRR